MTLRVVLEYDEVIDSWAAYCPEMPGINSCGATQEEAAANFKEAAEFLFARHLLFMQTSRGVLRGCPPLGG